MKFVASQLSKVFTRRFATSRVSLPISTADAFTSEPFSGNPAAVCMLPETAKSIHEGSGFDCWMRNVAAEMHLSETAFLRRIADRPNCFELRWWTPTDEVDLCGHATLASAHVLWNEGRATSGLPISFETKYSGRLVAKPSADGLIELDFPEESTRAVVPNDHPDATLIAKGLGIEASSLLHVARNRMDVLAEVSYKVFESMPWDLDFSTLSQIPSCRVLSVTAKGPTDFDFVSRAFAPSVGVNEDPVCGSAHCFLGPHWAHRLGRKSLIAKAASKRGGVVRVLVGDNQRVVLAGNAVTTMRGALEFGPGSPMIANP